MLTLALRAAAAAAAIAATGYAGKKLLDRYSPDKAEIETPKFQLKVTRNLKLSDQGLYFTVKFGETAGLPCVGIYTTPKPGCWTYESDIYDAEQKLIGRVLISGRDEKCTIINARPHIERALASVNAALLTASYVHMLQAFYRS